METLPSAMDASGEGESFGSLARPPVTAKGHQEKSGQKVGQQKAQLSRSAQAKKNRFNGQTMCKKHNHNLEPVT